MNINVGTLDRIIRIIGGIALIGLAVSGTIGVWVTSGSCRWSPGCFASAPPTDSSA